MKKIIIILIVVVVLGGVYYFSQRVSVAPNESGAAGVIER